MTDSMTPPPMSYSGYYQTGALTDDQELTRVGPGTACGEYMRRFWWPVAMVEVKDLPSLLRVLGEELEICNLPTRAQS